MGKNSAPIFATNSSNKTCFVKLDKLKVLYFANIIEKLKTYDQKFIELKDFDGTIQNENEADAVYVFINE